MPKGLKKKKFYAVSIVSCTGLASVGLASWLYFDNNQIESNVKIEIGASSETTAISFSNLNIQGSLYFDSYYLDNDGRVQNLVGSNEQLQIKLTGMLNGYNYDWEVVKFNFYVDSAHKEIYKNLIDKGYIEEPQFYTLDKNSLTNANPEIDGSFWRATINNNTRSFVTLATFSWGDFFDNMNPSLFFDSDNNNGIKSGKEYSKKEIKNILSELYELNGANYTIYIDVLTSDNSYNVNFDADGGHFSNFSDESIKNENNLVTNDSIKMPTPFKTGYKFLYWQFEDKKYYSADYIKIDDLFKNTSDRDITLVAIWQDLTTSGSVIFVENENASSPTISIEINSTSFGNSTLEFTQSAEDAITNLNIGDKIRIKSTINVGDIAFYGLSEADKDGWMIVEENTFEIRATPLQKAIINFNYNSNENSIDLSGVCFNIEFIGASTNTYYGNTTSQIDTSVGSFIKINTLHGVESDYEITGVEKQQDGTFKITSENVQVNFDLVQGFQIFAIKDSNDADNKNNPSITYSITKNNIGILVNEMKDVTTTNKSTGRVLESGDVVTIAKGDGCDSIVYNEQSYTSSFEITIGSSDIYLTLVGTAKGQCLLPYTKVMLANGESKFVKDIINNDILMTFNHLTGTFRTQKVVFNDFEDKQLVTVIKLEFSNGKTVEIISEHGFFDLDLNRYVYITENNFKDFIGHRFISVNVIDGSVQRSETTLVNASTYETYTEVYSPVTEYDLNYITEDVLSMPGGITGLFNIFEYNSDATINKEKMAEDIRRYGLFDYEKDFKNLISKYVFDVFNIQYLKVSLGKGMITEDYMQYLIERYTPLID